MTNIAPAPKKVNDIKALRIFVAADKAMLLSTLPHVLRAKLISAVPYVPIINGNTIIAIAVNNCITAEIMVLTNEVQSTCHRNKIRTIDIAITSQDTPIRTVRNIMSPGLNKTVLE